MDRHRVRCLFPTILLLETHIDQRAGPRFFLTLTSCQPLYGKLSDIFGRKPLMQACYTIFGVGCLGCGFARSMTELIIARVCCCPPPPGSWSQTLANERSSVRGRRSQASAAAA